MKKKRQRIDSLMIETKTDSYTYLEYRLDANSGFNSHIKINSKGGDFNINHYIK